MDFLKFLTDRYSVRKFKDQPVEDEKIKMILEAARVAPSAKNMQPTKVYVIKSEEGLKKIREITPATFDAPVVFMVCSDEANAWDSPFYEFNSGVMDTSIMATHMLLEVEALGLGTTWISWFDTLLAHKEFNIPDEYTVRLLLPVGYAADDAEPGPMHPFRKELSEFVEEL